MFQSIESRINALPTRKVLDPIRVKWPGVTGSIYRVERHVWSVVIFSTNPDDELLAIAAAVDALFSSLGLYQYVRNKQVEKQHYFFQIVEGEQTSRFPGVSLI